MSKPKKKFWTFYKIILLPFIGFGLWMLVDGLIKQDESTVNAGFACLVFFGGLFGLLSVDSIFKRD